MFVRPVTAARPTTARRRRRAVGAALAATALLSVTACSAADDVLPGSSSGEEPSSSSSGPAAKPKLAVNVKKGASDVTVDTLVEVTATDGEISDVTLSSPSGTVRGTVSDDGSTWTADDRLEPGTSYTVRASAAGEDGATVRTTSAFDTQYLDRATEETYASVAPLEGETVGVGMPVIVNFDVPVTDEAAMERNMHVTSTPSQPGTWHWVSEYEAHWRPKNYWEAGTEVDVDLDVNGVSAGGGIYGQEDRQVDFTVGDEHIYKIDAQTHQMQVFSNGEKLRTIPITTGKPGFTTRSGVKIIMEKFDSKRMNSETVGIGGAEAYDIGNVQWAMRLTNSGEFIHAAPWSVGSQGYANVSHGCTGMSTDNAYWLYSMTQRGDVTVTTGTDRAMEPDNGYGDWNIPFNEYKQGSALS